MAAILVVTPFALAMMGTATAATQIGSCTTIQSSGSYALTGDVTNTSAETCITVNASDVVLDGAGHVLGDGRTAIDVIDPASNVTVQNTTLRNWSRSGVAFHGTTDVTVRDLTIDLDGGDFGIYARGTEDATTARVLDNEVRGYLTSGIRVRSNHSEFEDNTVTTTYAGEGGIEVAGRNVTILSNNVQSTGGMGITIADAEDVRVIRNRIANVTGSSVEIAGIGIAVGFPATDDITLAGNTVVDNVNGIGFAATGAVEAVNNTIRRNRVGINVTNFGTAPASAFEAHDNTIVNNTAYGLLNTNDSVTNATYNDWGAADGPSGGVTDPIMGVTANGGGDAVSTNVHFDPWVGKSTSGSRRELQGCTVIDQSGSYALTSDLSFDTGNCIQIRASDVRFDGRGHTIEGIGFDDVPTKSGDQYLPYGRGISANGTGPLTNITVLNTSLIGVAGGVAFQDVEDGEIADVTVRRAANSSFIAGIAVVGDNGSREIDVVDSVVDGRDTESVGIGIGNPFPNLDDPESELEQTTVRDVAIERTTVTGTSIGVASRTSERLEIRNNRIVGNDYVREGSFLSLGTGVLLWSTGNSTLSGNAIRRNNLGLVTFDEAFDHHFGNVTNVSITGNAFDGNRAGLALFDIVDGTIVDNTVRSDDAAVIAADEVVDTEVADLDIGASTAPNTTLSMAPTNVNVSAASAPANNSEATSIGRYFAAENNTGFTQRDGPASLRVRLNYDEPDLYGVRERSLSLWRHEGQGNWTELNATVDTASNAIEANITSFSTFGVFGEESNATATGEYLRSSGDVAAPGELATVDLNLTNVGEEPAGFIVNITTAMSEPYTRDDAGGTWRPSRKEWVFLNVSPGESRTPSYTVRVPGDASLGNFTVRSEASSSATRTVVDDASATIRVVSASSILDEIDSNPGDCQIQSRELLRAIDLWQSGAEVPNTGGQTISTKLLLDVTNRWSSDATLTYSPECTD